MTNWDKTPEQDTNPPKPDDSHFHIWTLNTRGTGMFAKMARFRTRQQAHKFAKHPKRQTPPVLFRVLACSLPCPFRSE